MTPPSSHPIPSQACHSKSHCTGEADQRTKRPISLAPRFQDPFRDDFMASAKSFQKLNSFRRLFGFKHVQWNDTLFELTVVRSREFSRNKRTRMPVTIGGSRFNLGVPFFDIVMYFAAEYEKDKMVPVEKSLWNILSNHQSCGDPLLDPLVNFAAISVVKNKTAICFTVLMSKLPPFLFLPVMRRRSTRKDAAKRPEKWDKVIQEIEFIKNSLQTEDGEETDDESVVDKDDAKDRKHGNVDAKENSGALPKTIIDEYANDNLDETSWEDREEGSKTKTDSAQRVIFEVPLIQLPDRSISQLPSVILNFTEDASMESKFEDDKATGSDQPKDVIFTDTSIDGNASKQ